MARRYNQLSKLISKFIEGDCEVQYELDGFYYYDEGIIGYTLAPQSKEDAIWEQYLKDKYNFIVNKTNLFTMSILHELGHHYTLEYLPKEEQERDIVSELLAKRDRKYTEDELQIAYFDTIRESMATEWAIAYYKAFPSKMRKWNQRFNCSIRHYQKKK